MGGSAGHMAHPFDCREVRNGRDLINFYIKAVNSIPLYQGETPRSEWLADFGGVNPSSVKFDGVNASFRLEKTNNSAGFMFVHDRGAKNQKSDVGKIDFSGITPDNSLERFKKPDHGMIYVVKIMSKILNHDLMKVRPYIEALGIFEKGIGPEGVIFNAEFYSNKSEDVRSIKNVTDYNQNFIAIHNLQDFHTEETMSKRGVKSTSRKTRGYYWQAQEEVDALLDQKDKLQTQKQDISKIDALIAEKNQDLYRRQNEHQEIIDKFAGALAENANSLDLPFNVHTQVGLQFKEGLSRELVLKKIDNALNGQVKGFFYKKINENMSVGPTIINEQTGEARARTLKELLFLVNENPAHTVYFPEEFKKTKSDGSQTPSTADIKVNSEFSQRHANKKGKPLSTRQSAFAKKIYEDVMVTGYKTGLGVADIGGDDVSSNAIHDAVILWHAVRIIGNVLKESVLSKEDFGLPMSEQEGIVIKSEKICDGIPFKFTGEFIVSGQDSQFRQDAPPAMNEVKLKYGEMLESFMVEAEPGTGGASPLVVLIPGGFKPPTNGHYSMIKHYENRSDVSKVVVVTGFKPRKEPGLTVTHEQSKAIFELYGGFSDKVEFRDQGSWATPMTTCYELVKDEKFVSEFQGAVFAMGASDKDNDKKRIGAFFNYFQKNPARTRAQVVNFPPAKAFEVDGEAASATRMRKAFTAGDWETFKKLMPNDNQYDDVIQVLNKQIQEPVNENFLLARPRSFLVEGPREANKLSEELDTNTENILRNKISQALSNVLAYLPSFKTEDKAEMVSSIGPAVYDQITKHINMKQDQAIDPAEEAEEIENLVEEDIESLEEISSMAGSAVEGHSGIKSPWLQQEEQDE